MKCEICGKETDLFTEVYDPRTEKHRAIYLCHDHHISLLNSVDWDLKRMKDFYAYKEEMEEIGRKALEKFKEAADNNTIPVLDPTDGFKDIAKVLAWLYVGGIQIHGVDKEVEAAIRRIGGEEE